MARTSSWIIAALFVASASWASAPLNLMWRRVSFETDPGDRVLLEVQDEMLSRVFVKIDGRDVVVPESLLKDIELPVLSRADLIYSGGMGGKITKYVSLQIPVFDPELEIQDPDPIRRYEFVFHNGKLIRRVLEERQGVNWTAVEIKNIDLQ